MKLLVCGGAGFIGSNFVRLRSRERATRSSCSTSSPTRAGARTSPTSRATRGFRFVHGAIEDPRRGRRRARRRRRDRQLRRRDARRPLDPGARRVRAHPRARHLRAARGGPRARHPLPAGLDRRGLRLDRRGLVHRGLAAAPVLALQRDEGRRRPARRLLPRDLRRRCRDLPRLQQLRAPPAPGEADPADGAQRARRATACRSTATASTSATGSSSRTSPPRSPTCSSTACAGEVYNVGGPDECPNIEVVRRILELCGRDESLIDYVTDRPGHDRRYSLGSEKVQRARLVGARALRRGPRARPSPGIARTPGGGSRSAAAPTASTTSASTGARLAPYRTEHRSPAASCPTACAAATVLMTFVPLSSVCTVAVALRAVHDDRLDRQREVADRLQLVR